MAEVWLLVAVGVVVAVLVVLGWRQLEHVPRPQRDAWSRDAGPGGRRVTLDLDDADPDTPAVQRLVRDVAIRVLAAEAGLDRVEVVDRTGRRLGEERRPAPLPPEVAIPDQLREPHARGRHGPSPVPRADVQHPGHVPGAAPEVASVPLADRFQLPVTLRARLADPDDATGLVAEILRTAGRDVTRDGDLLRTDDVAVAVVDTHDNPERALSHGFLRIDATDARRGIVLRLGLAEPASIRRREAAAPHVRHVGPDAIQRMADAAEAGADPIAFATGPVTVG